MTSDEKDKSMETSIQTESRYVKNRREMSELVLKGQFTKKESRRTIEDVLTYARLSKADKIMLLIELLEKTKDGDYQ
jgi:hypothetical protein